MSIDISNAVVVITGASSGIGRAAAHAFAYRGATLVLAARGEEALQETLEQCRRLGGRGITMAVDVQDADQVEQLAQRAVQEYGRIDVWVNNAAVTLFGRLEETPRDEYEQVLHTNIFGYVNGCRAAIRRFREQGRGRLINVASIVGMVGQPYTSAYVMSKWAIRGLSECLRMELMDAPDIRVSTVLPATIDTPLFQHAANHTGRRVKAMKPVYTPEQVAESIVRLVRWPRREVMVGNAGRMLGLMRTLFPSLGERMMARQVESDHLGPPHAPDSDGNLFRPERGRGHLHGGWIEREHGSSQQRARRIGMAVGLAALAVPIGVAAVQRWRST